MLTPIALIIVNAAIHGPSVVYWFAAIDMVVTAITAVYKASK